MLEDGASAAMVTRVIGVTGVTRATRVQNRCDLQEAHPICARFGCCRYNVAATSDSVTPTMPMLVA